MGNPLEHFELHRLIPISLFGIDISINEAVVMMWVVVLTVFGLFWLASRDMKSIPGRLQSMVEVAVEFLRGMIRDNMGEEEMAFLPFLGCLFLFILFSNLWGLVPGAYTVTSQLIVTGTFAVLVYLLSVYVGFARHGLGFFRIFFPPGAPGWILPFHHHRLLHHPPVTPNRRLALNSDHQVNYDVKTHSQRLQRRSPGQNRAAVVLHSYSSRGAPSRRVRGSEKQAGAELIAVNAMPVAGWQQPGKANLKYSSAHDSKGWTK